MLKKDDFTKAVSNEDKSSITKIYDKICIAVKSGKTIYTNEFFTPDIWSQIIKLQPQLDIKVFSDGIFNEAERRMLAFSQEDNVIFPMKLISIINKSKFHRLEHKDYLGALMSLGIKREKLGDLIVGENRCYFAACDELYTYIESNIDSIGRCPCEISEIVDLGDLPQHNYEERLVISTSMRADCIVSAVTGLSRSKSVELISSGKLLLNYVEEREKDVEVPLSSTVTIRGYGKFKINEIIGNSSSGRLKLTIKKFI